jgi:hypothetical protein
MALMWGMNSLKTFVLVDDSIQLSSTLAGMRVLSDLLDDPTALNERLEEV